VYSTWLRLKSYARNSLHFKVITNKGFLFLLYGGFLQHGSFLRDHLQEIHMPKTAKRHRVMRDLYMNDISFVQFIGSYFI
jgi:hypothetical protein